MHYSKFVVAAATAACISFQAWADSGRPPAIQNAKTQSEVDATVQAQMATLMSQWSAAVGSFAMQAGSAIPWNQMNSTTPINYAPMYLYAGQGGASACNFQGKSGSPLPAVGGLNLSQPVNLAGVSLDLSGEQSEQAKAIQSVVGVAMRFQPSESGGPLSGTFCAAVAFNKPAEKQIQIVTWYVPAITRNAIYETGNSTPKALVSRASRQLSDSVANTQLSGNAEILLFDSQTGWKSWTSQRTSPFGR